MLGDLKASNTLKYSHNMRPKKPQRVLDARKSGNPILATEGTGENDVEIAKGLALGVDAYFTKPVVEDALMAKIKALMANSIKNPWHTQSAAPKTKALPARPTKVVRPTP